MPRWWLPERWAVVDELPRTSVGKLDKKRLRVLAAEGGLDVDRLGEAVRGGVETPPVA
jgi:fatty-acyl-CoA synthase